MVSLDIRRESAGSNRVGQDESVADTDLVTRLGRRRRRCFLGSGRNNNGGVEYHYRFECAH